MVCLHTVGLLALVAFASAWSIQQPFHQSSSSSPRQHHCTEEDEAKTSSGLLEAAQADFEFENPETDCKYASQPWIYETFSKVATDLDYVFQHVSPDAHFRIMGHHPFAGHYYEPKIAYVNSLWRLNQCLKDQAVDAKVMAIHGGCNDKWSVQEFYFNATTNRGLFWELTSLWVSRWDENNVIQEVRTYVDAGQIMRTLWDNEIYWNSSDRVTHREYQPGPGGVPDWINATEMSGMAKLSPGILI